jgi:hypothetical protein
VRPAAQIEPVALLVDLDGLVGRDRVDQFDLEHLAIVAEYLLCLFAGPDLLGERLVARDDLAHLLFDRSKILRRERLVAEEIVIEAVLDRGTDGHLRSRPQRLHRFGQHMRAIVPDQLQRARIVTGDEFNSRILLDRVGEIADHAIQRHRHRALGQRRRDALGDIEAGDAFGEFAFRAVGEGEGDLRGFDRFQVGEAELES